MYKYEEHSGATSQLHYYMIYIIKFSCIHRSKPQSSAYKGIHNHIHTRVCVCVNICVYVLFGYVVVTASCHKFNCDKYSPLYFAPHWFMAFSLSTHCAVIRFVHIKTTGHYHIHAHMLQRASESKWNLICIIACNILLSSVFSRLSLLTFII